MLERAKLDWVGEALQEISSFLAANGLPDSAQAVRDAARFFELDSCEISVGSDFTVN
jgi:hypothetical protein